MSEKMCKSSGLLGKLPPVGIVLANLYSKPKKTLWHPSLTMISEDLTTIEHAVLECAHAGCSSIWVCCDETFQPAIRNILGNFVKDPVLVSKSTFTKFPRDNQVDIPIYYYMVHPKDRTRRTGPVWDALNTSLTIYHISKNISRWVIPEKYFISRCYGIYDLNIIRQNRENIRKKKNILLYHSGSSFLDDEYLSFTLDSKSIKNILFNLKRENVFKELTTIGYSDIIELFNIEDFHRIEVEEYHNCSDWESYKDYLTNTKTHPSYDGDFFFNKRSKN